MSKKNIKKRILVVDDEESVCNMVKLNLEESGRYEVRTETEGRNAFAAAYEFKPDLILLDVVMLDMDGGGVASQIESDEGLKNIPIVFLTAIVSRDELISEGGIIGGRPYIAKPTTTERLIKCIEKYIGK